MERVSTNVIIIIIKHVFELVCRHGAYQQRKGQVRPRLIWSHGEATAVEAVQHAIIRFSLMDSPKYGLQ
jgi:hypothetical protein